MSREGRSQPVTPIASHGFVDPGPAPVGTTPPPATVIENDDRRKRLAVPQAIVLSGVLAGTVVTTSPSPPAPLIVPLDERGRRASLQLATVAHGYDNVVPTLPEIIESVNRQRWQAIPPLSISGVLATSFIVAFISPPKASVVEYDARRQRYPSLDPIALSAALHAVPGSIVSGTIPFRTLVGVGT